MPQRPTGVTVFGILEIIFSGFTIFSTLISLLTAVAMPQVFSMYGAGYIWYIYVSLVVSFLVGVGGLCAGIGILMLKEWARKLLLGIGIFAVVTGLVNVILSFTYAGVFGMFSLFGFILGLVYYGLIFWYFLKPDVKAVFS